MRLSRSSPGLHIVVGSAVAVAAACLVVAGAAAAQAPLPSLPVLAGCLALLFVGVRLHLPLRLGAQRVELSWSEVGLLLAFGLAPAQWVVLLTPIAVGASLVQRRFLPLKIAYNVASYTAAAGSAAAVLALAGLSRPFAGVELLVVILAGSVAGLLSYLAVAVVVAVAQDVPLLATWRASAGLQAITLAGNLVVAAGVLALARYGPLAVAFAAAAVLGLHQRYEGRLRSHQERESGHRHAAAVGRLTEDLDEPRVLQRAAKDACDLADADVVDVELPTHNGFAAVLHRHSRRGDVWVGHPAAAPDLPARVVADLPVPTADGALPGRLRVWLASGAPDLRPGQSKEAALRSLAEHTGAAVRNARIHAQQTYYATHDRLTGLPARQLLIEQIEQPLRAGKLSSHEPVALVVVDLLGFRKLSRVFGPDVADDILSLTAERLRAAADPGEYVAHVHADDFGIYFPAAGDPAQVRRRAMQFVAAAATPMPLGTSEIMLEAAAGAVFSGTPVGSGSELLRQAAIALDSAIHAGLSVEFYDPAKDDVGSPAAVVMRSELPAALDEDQLVLLYQPIIHLPSGSPVAMEALARWKHPTKGLLSAAEFITVLENSPDHDRFVDWQLDTALSTRARWAADRDLPVSINLATRCLVDRQFPRRVAAALTRAGVPGHQLMAEFDEDDILTGSMGSVAGVLTELQLLGVRVAIDGFGAGDARFFGLLRVPADYLKVDGYYVRQMFVDPEAMATVCVGLDLGRRVDLQVVAAGVSSAEHVARLSQLGCNVAQGPYLAPPLHPDAIASYLQTAPASRVPKDVVVPLDSRRRIPPS